MKLTMASSKMLALLAVFVQLVSSANIPNTKKDLISANMDSNTKRNAVVSAEAKRELKRDEGTNNEPGIFL
ncbi:hypothetical protein C8J56DRAFT_923169 [Mycena floridula]|nr:hypothetical protein C8J56DRAFT_923169 [Mycena floridula]